MSRSPYLIPTSLCTRCGACYAADSGGILAKDLKGFPLITDAAPESEITRLKKVCTGVNWQYRALLDYTHGPDYPYDPSSPDKGKILELGIAYSCNEDLIEKGQSGGVTTSIVAAALATNLIDSFLAVRRPVGKGKAFSAEPFIVRSINDLREAAGSKYTISTSLELLPVLENESHAYALSLLPCQTAGIRKMQLLGLADPNKCKLVVGPFCGFNMEREAGREIARRLKINPGEVVEFGNRKGDFPGETLFKTADGDIKTLDRTAHRALYKIFTPERCFTCTDFTNELADLSIADCWIPNDSGGYKYPQGAAWILVRTSRGRGFVENAVKAGYLNYEETPLDANDAHWKESILQRKVRAFNRVHLSRDEGRLAPNFDHEIPDKQNSFYKLDRSERNLRKLLAVPIIRHYFLNWWIKIHISQNTIFEKKAKSFLGTRLFTHHSNAVSPIEALKYLIIVYLKNNRYVRFIFLK